MQANSLTDNLKEAAEQQANFIMLRALEQKLPPQMFDQVLFSVQQSCNLPKRIDWKGNVRDLSFDELKVNFAQVDQNYLPQLVEYELTGHKQNSGKLNYNHGFLNKDVTRVSQAFVRPKNLLMRQRNMPYERLGDDSIQEFRYDEVSKFERMKTVFGHCLIDEGCHAPIYNVKYDQTDNFIISGADDCIIKIWDKQTMNLQASLHSHEDVITDIDISKCNRYLASASIDGKIIVWDWQNCKKLDEITDHRANVNNIKFFSLYTKTPSEENSIQEEIQILVSCSEDGTVRIYDEIAYLEQLANSDSPNQGRRNNRGRPQTANSGQQQLPQRDRFCLILQPNDFRVGARNKKINTVHINKNGTVAAGTDRGEILIWSIDLKAFVKSQTSKNPSPQSIVSFIDSFKMFSKAVHFCEFSPNGCNLFIGSDDGTAKIWKIEKGKDIKLTATNELVTFEVKRKPSNQDKNLMFTDTNGNILSLAEHKEKKSKWDCDSIAWSVNGRYAITAISGKFDEDSNHVSCFIKVWDSFTDELIPDIAKGTTANLSNSTFVLSPHPTIEEIFMSGGDGGNICLWNISKRQLIQKFLEYGIYSYEKYTMNDPKCGRFSNNGSSFVVGSGTGTLSLFACDGTKFQYAATRVEQFFVMDDIKHPHNIYYELEDGTEPQICGYSLIPYEIQPSSPLIGKFKNARQYTSEEYERNLVIRQHICKDEEDFLMAQLAEGLDNNMFNPDNQGMNFEMAEQQDEFLEVRRRGGRQVIQSQNSLSSIEMVAQRNNGSQEDLEALNRIRQAERRPFRGGRRGIIQARNVRNIMQPRANGIPRRINPNFDPDNSLYDRESDENFEIPEATSALEDDENVIAELERESSEDLGMRRGRNAARRVNVVFEANDPRRPPTRQTRRNYEEESKVQVVTRRTRRQISDNSEPSAQSDSDDHPDDTYEMSDIDHARGAIRTRGRQANRSESRKKPALLPSSDDESVESMLFSDDYEGARGRSKRLRSRKDASRSKSKSKRNESAGRNLRTRGQRVNYNESRSCSDQSLEEEDKKALSESEEEKINSKNKRRQRAVVDESQDEAPMENLEDTFKVDEPSKKLKGDEDYDLIVENVQLEEDMIEHPKLCNFCNRADGQMIGPFIKTKDPSLSNMKLYFHQDCLEVSSTTFYDKNKNKWMNIGKALKDLSRKPIMCDRCGNQGATIKCTDCRKCYHGYYCSSLYMIYIAQREYQCFECRNSENFKNFSKSPQMDKVEYKHMKRAIPRELYLASRPSREYLPQIGDEIYYFFQGHEKFIHAFNCFFYCGDSDELSIQYPWRQHLNLSAPTLCKILDVVWRFPTLNAMALLKKFGKTMEISQIPQVILRLTLAVTNDLSQVFVLDYFPSALPDFLVPREIYESSNIEFQKLQASNSFVNSVFQKRGGAKYRILGVKNYEDIVNIDTNWQTVQCQLEEQYRLRGRERRSLGRREQNALDSEPPQFANFWEFELPSVPQRQLRCLDENTRAIIINTLQDFIARKSDICTPFMSRVTEKVARDYRDHIPGEMFLTLISERLTYNYYRSLEQMFADLDQIYENSKIYNSLDSELTQMAKKIAESAKKAIKQALSSINFYSTVDDELKKLSEVPVKSLIDHEIPKRSVENPAIKSKSVQQTNNLMNGGKKTYNDEESLDVEMETFKKSDNPMKIVLPPIPSRPGRVYQEEQKLVQDPLIQSLYGNNNSPDELTAGMNLKPQRGRRVTRRAAADQIISESAPVNASNSKITIQLNHSSLQPSNNEEVGLLGKSTRSGRSRKVAKASLKEDSESDCHDYDEEEHAVRGSKKRARHV